MPSKLSFHIIGFDDRIFDLLQQMQPSCVKLLDFPSDMNVDAIRGLCPRTLIVYRQTAAIDSDFNRAPEEYLALPPVQDAMNKLKGRGIVWEGLNEPIVNTATDAGKVNAWYKQFANLMHARGEKVAAFSFSTGNPVNLDLVPLLADAARACDYIALHEYFDASSGNSGYARYRNFILRLPADARKPVIITECGTDDGGHNPAGSNQGWKSYYSDMQYLAQLKSYDQQLLADQYVVGSTIFQYGGGFPWATFEVTSIGKPIADYVASVGGGAFPLPVSVPPPAPGDGWCPFATRVPTTKFWEGNQGRRAVCLHIAQGGYDAAVRYLSDPQLNPDASAHFVIGKDGRIAQLVSIHDSAWANGLAWDNVNQRWLNPRGVPVNPSWVDLIPGVNPNRYTISIEHEGFYTEFWTPAMDAANTRLLKWLAGQFNWTYVPHRSLIGHYELDPVDRPNCPGPHVNYEQIANDANQGTTAAVSVVSVSFSPTTVVTSQLLNVSITVRNDSSTTVPTMGPNPGFIYEESDTFQSRGFVEIAGAYRIGIDFDGRTGIDHPYRWGFGTPLAPGEIRVITGQIRLKTIGTKNYWAGLAREQVVWIQDRQGTQAITVTPAPPPVPTVKPNIIAVNLSPTTLDANRVMNVSITVRNDGTGTAPTMGPDPGFLYDEGDTFRSRGFAEINGAYRVGIDFDGRIGIDHPYRWGFGASLAPGETRVITGQIRLKTPGTKNYWAGLVREQIAWLQDQRGVQPVTVNAPPSGQVDITAVTLAPTVMDQGQVLKVTVTLKNNSLQPVASQGPTSNFQYNEGDNYLTKQYPPETNAYRIGLDYDQRTGIDHPYRWGFDGTLMPGQSITITGFVRLNRKQTVNYWVALIQERVGIQQDRVGTTFIEVQPA